MTRHPVLEVQGLSQGRDPTTETDSRVKRGTPSYRSGQVTSGTRSTRDFRKGRPCKIRRTPRPRTEG